MRKFTKQEAPVFRQEMLSLRRNEGKKEGEEKKMCDGIISYFFGILSGVLLSIFAVRYKMHFGYKETRKALKTQLLEFEIHWDEGDEVITDKIKGLEPIADMIQKIIDADPKSLRDEHIYEAYKLGMKIKKLSHHRYYSDVNENEIREDGAQIKEGVEKLVKIF